jgi:hypothetical protein
MRCEETLLFLMLLPSVLEMTQSVITQREIKLQDQFS